MLDPGTIEAVLFDTVFGRAWCWHLGLEIALLGLVAMAPARPLHAGATSLVALLALGHVASLAWAGHAVMHPGLSHVLVQVIHLLAGGLWLGSLPALFHLAALARRPSAGAARDALRRMLPLYSRMGYVAVASVLVTGLLNSWFLVGSVAALFSTAFGLVLLAKIVLVLLMVAVAAANRFVFQPRIMAPGGDGSSSVRALWWSVGLEQILGGLVLAAVSLLGTLPPAMSH
jgi:putative copper resistance protein D